MSIIALDGNRFSQVVKMEFNPATAFCRDAVTFNGTAITLQVGTVLGAYIASPTLVAGAVSGTGNGTVGSISVVSTQNAQLGVYKILFTSATAFDLYEPNGRAPFSGTVGTAFSKYGVSFTVTAGGTAFVAGDSIPLTLAGTVKYKLVEATATDGSQFAKAIFLADNLGLSRPTLTVAATDTVMVAMTRGPAIVNKAALTFGASVTGAFLTQAYAQLTAAGILPEVQV